MQQSAVFMQQWLQKVNNIGDLRKVCHKEAFFSFNIWKNRNPHVIQKLMSSPAERGPGKNQRYTMEGGVKQCHRNAKQAAKAWKNQGHWVIRKG